MRLEEIEAGSAADLRVKRMKANAKSAKDRAKQLQAQAEAGAEQLRMRQSREKLAQIKKTSMTSMIKPYR
jgi:hypothetical protein